MVATMNSKKKRSAVALSVDAVGFKKAEIPRGYAGPWKVRWTEWVTIDGQRTQQCRSLQVSDNGARDELVAKIRRALESGSVFEPEARAIVRVGSFDAGARGWLALQKTRCKPKSIKAYKECMKRWFGALRSVLDLKESEPVPCDKMTRETFSKAVAAIQATHDESTVYHTARAGLVAWVWTADDPKAYPGTVTPPRDRGAILPKRPQPHAPNPPTLPECDAALRRVQGEHYRDTAAIMRTLGLRIEQSTQIHGVDFELVDDDGWVMAIRKGKGSELVGRKVPVPDWLVEHLGPRIAASKGGPLFPSRAKSKSKYMQPTAAPMHAAWAAATKAGKVAKEKWHPEGRSIARPDHAFRGALQTHLTRCAVRAEVIKALVGHHGGDTQTGHYVPHSAFGEAMREASNLILPITWEEPTPTPEKPALRLVG